MKHKRIFAIVFILIIILFSLKIKAQCDEWKQNLIHIASFVDPSSSTYSVNVVNAGKINSWDETPIKSKHFFAFEAGIQNRRYFGNHYIKPYFDTMLNPAEHFPLKDYYGFNYINNVSWHAGLLYYYKFKKNIRLGCGVDIINRKTILNSNPDSVIKYQISYDVYEYVYNDICFEIPLFIEFSIKYFNIDLGGNLSTFRINYNYSYRLFSSRLVDHYKTDFNDVFYPMIKCSYEFVLRNNYKMRIYIGAEYLSSAIMNTSAKAFDFKTGISLLKK